MIRYLIGAAIGFAILASAFTAGIRTQKALDEQAIARAKAQFEQTVREANEAYANQWTEDNKVLADLKAKVDETPPNTTIAIKKDMTSRIGTIK